MKEAEYQKKMLESLERIENLLLFLCNNKPGNNTFVTMMRPPYDVTAKTTTDRRAPL